MREASRCSRKHELSPENGSYLTAAAKSGPSAAAHFQPFARGLFNRMPVASPPTPPRAPAPLQEAEREFIKETVKRFYGSDAVARNFGPDPDRLELHVETDADLDMRKFDCLGVLLTHIDRRQIDLEVTKRGAKAHGIAKMAYRQGVIL